MDHYVSNDQAGSDIKCCLVFPVKCGFMTLAVMQTCGLIMYTVMIGAIFAMIAAVSALYDAACK